MLAQHSRPILLCWLRCFPHARTELRPTPSPSTLRLRLPLPRLPCSLPFSSALLLPSGRCHLPRRANLLRLLRFVRASGKSSSTSPTLLLPLTVRIFSTPPPSRPKPAAPCSTDPSRATQLSRPERLGRAPLRRASGCLATLERLGRASLPCGWRG
jgi:hypothetical protein